MQHFKVFVVGGDGQIESMYRGRGDTIVKKQEEADIIQFIGGADVDPELYGEPIIRGTQISPNADKRDIEAWRASRPDQIKAGICRGGQFLNVMNGGAMWQHVSGHAWQFPGHDVVDLLFGNTLKVSSTHHQMMIPHKSGEVLAQAKGVAFGHKSGDEARTAPKYDTEVVYYEGTRSLCFQPHPEYAAFKDCRNYYFDLLEFFFDPQNPAKQVAKAS